MKQAKHEDHIEDEFNKIKDVIVFVLESMVCEFDAREGGTFEFSEKAQQGFFNVFRQVEKDMDNFSKRLKDERRAN